jgi:HSP20 family molecular chaperone IbpA
MADSLVRDGSRGQASRMTPWTPFRDLLGFDPFHSLRSNWAFEYDVTRTENGYEVDVPVPGFKPEDVDPDKIEARVNDGMLVLTLARRPEAQPRRIDVK